MEEMKGVGRPKTREAEQHLKRCEKLIEVANVHCWSDKEFVDALIDVAQKVSGQYPWRHL